MKKINLRKFYPSLYRHDYFCDVTDEVAEVLEAYRRCEMAKRCRAYRYRAIYSLDRNDGIENEAMYVVPSADMQLEYIAGDNAVMEVLQKLSETQRRRFYARFFLNMSYGAIAKMEGVSKNAIKCFIDNAVVTILKTLKIF